MKNLQKAKEFDIRKFLKKTLGEKEGHYSFYKIQDFARLKKKERSLPKYDAMNQHLKECADCKSTYDNVVRFDPFLSKGKEIPQGYWESVWQEFEQNIPAKLKILLTDSAVGLDKAEKMIEKTVEIELSAHKAEVEGVVFAIASAIIEDDQKPSKEEIRKEISTYLNFTTELVATSISEKVKDILVPCHDKLTDDYVKELSALKTGTAVLKKPRGVVKAKAAKAKAKTELMGC